MDRAGAIEALGARVDRLELRLARAVQAGLAAYGALDEVVARLDGPPGAAAGGDPGRLAALRENLAAAREAYVELADALPEPA